MNFLFLLLYHLKIFIKFVLIDLLAEASVNAGNVKDWT